MTLSTHQATTDAAAPTSPRDTALHLDGDLSSAIGEVARMLEHEGNVTSVFGAPVKLDTKTIIPVAFVQVGTGGGGVIVPTAQRLLERVRRLLPIRIGAGGGGFGIHVRPVGYLHEEDGHVIFTRIEAPMHPRRPGQPQAPH